MQKEISFAFKVPKTRGEQIRRLLNEKKLLRTDLIIVKDKKHLYIPIHAESIKENIDFPMVKKTFKRREQKTNSYKDILQLPMGLQELLPTSFDIIGSILLVKLPEELVLYKKDIGKALLATQKHVETVCLVKPVTGELRTRDVEIIAGKKTTLTIHKEHGLFFYVDIEKTYFSPRLAGERKRIADQVQQNEVIVDMFTGVAPFPIMIATYAQPAMIIAVDKNKEAVHLAKKNCALNKTLDTIEIICDDAVHIESLMKKKQQKADRVIMNLPFKSFDFLPFALRIINNKGIIHFYEIVNEDIISQRVDELKKTAKKQNVTIIDIFIQRIKTYAPREFYIGIDITAQKN